MQCFFLSWSYRQLLTTLLFLLCSETKLELLTRQLVCHAAANLEANPDLPSEVSTQPFGL